MSNEPRAPRLAVLIDADNASSRIATRLFEEIAKIGEASVRRIYGDFCQRRYKKGPATGLKVGQSIQTKSLSLRLGLIGVGEAAVA